MPAINIDMVAFQTSSYGQNKLLALCKWVWPIDARPANQTVQPQLHPRLFWLAAAVIIPDPFLALGFPVH
jgi:hypothetical protein